MNQFRNIPQLSLSIVYCFILFSSCNQASGNKEQAINTETPIIEKNKILSDKEKSNPSKEFKAYWYAGEAEISSYKLEQARYGEIREGKAVLVYVTEPFLPKKQVKADAQGPNDISVLKLNATKNFNTGIYPYSIMQSTFYPVSNTDHALKVSASIQEWCGQVYTQLNNRSKFEIMSHSYFETEADESFKIDKEILENELWTKLRINPNALPTGDMEIIPSLEFIRLKHIILKAYKATAKLSEGSYKIHYPEINRSLTIDFNPEFPYDIRSWEETYSSGFGSSAQVLTTKAVKIKTIKSAYWNKNKNSDAQLRKKLELN